MPGKAEESHVASNLPEHTAIKAGVYIMKITIVWGGGGWLQKK